MEAIVALPAIVALAVCVLASPARAFLDLYLPVLLLVPIQLAWDLPGLPDLTFQSAALLPIAAVLLTSTSTRWRWSLSDGIMGLYLATMCLSEFRAAGLAETQDLAVDLITCQLLPYVVAKILIAEPGFAERLAKRVVVILCLVSLLSLWQFRMGSVPLFRGIWTPLFPDIRLPGTSQYRWGLARITGPYGHSILAGIIMGTGLLLQVWLHASRRWSPRSLSWLLTGGLVLGCFMPMSRGPWLGLILGGALAMLGLVHRRRRLVVSVLIGAALVGPPAIMALQSYVSVDRRQAETQLQENAAYRAELLEEYVPVVLDKPLLGWGRDLWPANESLLSTDNAYLLLALEHGLLSVLALTLLIGWISFGLARLGARAPPRSQRAQLAFILLGSITCTMVSITTVWLGNQTEPLLFLIVGCSEGLITSLQHAPATVVGARRSLGTARPSHGLRRVLS